MRSWATVWAVAVTVLLLGVSAAGLSPGSAPSPVDLDRYPWLYLRAGRPLTGGETPAVLITVGDLMPGRGVVRVQGAFDRVAPWLRQADLVLGNLEGVPAAAVPHAGGTVGHAALGPIRLILPYKALPELEAAGFDLLGLANNHALDAGPAALAQAARRLQQAGLTPLGAGPDPASAWQPIIRQVGEARLAFLAVNALPAGPQDRGGGAWAPAGWDTAQARAAVSAAREAADAVIVSVHWGYEDQARADPLQKELAEVLVQAGADLVVGHHPHTVQGTQVRPASGRALWPGEALVAFSLGNFVFDRYDGGARWGLALRAFFDQHGLRAVQALPVWAGGRPALVPPESARSLLTPFLPPPYNLGYRCLEGVCRPVPVAQRPLDGQFWAGEADLTGDGRPEQINRRGAGVTISAEGARVWESPAEWRVLDLALGDPNDDGRQELLLALEKPDADGVPRSQPFMVGYRGGTYRVLWGGSTVADPILEVELGDVTGDGREELVVLEASGPASERVLSVWRWHGWGFSLLWRSPRGRYQDVALLDGPAGSPATILAARPWHASRD